MRKKIIVQVAALCLVGPTVSAKPKGKARRAKRGLAAKVDQALKATAETAAAVKAIKELKQQLADLQQEVEQLKAAKAAGDALSAKQQALEKKQGDLELKLGAIRMDLVMDKSKESRIAGYRDGFFLQNPGRDYLLRFRGLLQGAYTGHIFSERISLSAGNLGENSSSFDLRRARLEFGGHVVSKVMRYRLELEFGEADPGPLLQAYGEVAFSSYLNVRFGRMKIPMGRQFLTSAAYQFFTDRSGVVGAFMPGWDLGLVVSGDFSLLGSLTYEIGLFNGAGSVVHSDDNTDFLYVTRVVFSPLGALPYSEDDSAYGGYKVAVGGAFTYNLARTDRPLRLGVTEASDRKRYAALRDRDGDDSVDNVAIYMISAEVVARLKRILWQTEFFYRIEDPGAGLDYPDTWGIYSQVWIVPHWANFEVAARDGFFKPHHYGASQELPVPESVHEVSAVAGFYIWKRRVKWQVEYTFQFQQNLKSSSEEKVDSLNMHQIRLQTQVYF